MTPPPDNAAGPFRPGAVRAAVELPLRYILRPGQALPARELIVLLHGFGQDGKSIADPLLSILPENAAVIAPDGPFPVPRRTRDGAWKVGFSWYFWKSEDRSFYIDMTGALDLIERAINVEGLADLPKRVIGFSQGGWLAPVLAGRLAKVSHVIGVGCEFALDRTPPPLPFRFDAVHGDSDEIVPLTTGRESFARMREAGVNGRFFEIKGGTHGFDLPMIEGIRLALSGGQGSK